MGGQIAATSEIGRGTTFRVMLPASGGTLSVPSAAPPISPAPTRRVAVLVVDDEPAVGISLGRVLREYEVTVVTKASEALDLVSRGNEFDVIFSDLMMAEMSGMDLYDELARRYPIAAQRMIFVTGGAFTPAAHAFLDRVPNERLEKPFSVKSVRALVQRFAQ
jgi:CheY-like chemotaxis protein